jgi:cis-L-3-hydroxyproline dehydratase
MELTAEEKALLAGEGSEANRLAMEVLVRAGDAFGAERLIEVASAHILGHYGSLHQAGIDYLERLVEGGGRCRVPTTVDPSSVDFARADRFRVPEEYRRRQERLKGLVEALGVTPTWSCTPYASQNVPRFGENVAWAESSAVAYANSIIGARTNRTPFGLDIAAALTGRIPLFGLYREESRRGSLLFRIKVKGLTDFDYHSLGAIVGRLSGSKIPVIDGIPANVTNDQLKMFSSAAASAGSVALFHMTGITPEASLADPFRGMAPEETVEVHPEDLEVVAAGITTAAPGEPVDMVTLGCPLLSIGELQSLAAAMEGRRVRRGVRFWIYLAADTYETGKAMGLVQPLEESGVWFSTGTCATVSPVRVWGFRHIMTNSAKCALVVPSEHNARITFRDTAACIAAATETQDRAGERGGGL